MGMFDSILGSNKKKKSEPQLLEPAWQTQLREELAQKAKPKAMERLDLAGTAYPGQLTAPLSGPEQTGLKGLEGYLASALPTEGSLYGAAKGEVEKTLGGQEYDPIGGAYYQAYRTQVMRELEEAKDRLGAQTSARDKFFGGGRIQVAGELEEQATSDLAMILGQLFERERERKSEAVPEAMRLATFEEMAPLQRVEASQRFGALPRQVEQSALDAEYAEWIRQMTDLGIPLDVATGMSTYQPSYFMEEPTPAGGGYGDIASVLGQIFSQGGDEKKKDSDTDMYIRLAMMAMGAGG